MWHHIKKDLGKTQHISYIYAVYETRTNKKPTEYNKFNLQDHATPRHVGIRSRQITSNYYDYNSPKPELRTCFLREFQHGNSHILGVTNRQFYCIRYNLPIDLDFITLL